MTLASVARRAEVAKSTAYARWDTAADLLADVLVETVDLGPTPDTGSLRGDLGALARQIVTVALRPPMLELHMQFWLMGPRAPQRYRDYQRTGLGMALRQGRTIFAQAAAREEITGDLDVDAAMAAFIGSLLLRALSSPTHSPPSAAAIRRIVALFVDQLVATSD